MRISHEKKPSTKEIVVEIDATAIDIAIEKANRLVMLLREAATIIDSLSSGGQLES